MTTTPYSFQTQSLKQIKKWNGRGLLSLAMGLGKSPIALWYAEGQASAWPLVIVCPASLKYKWRNECRKHLMMNAEILEGRKPPRKFRTPHLITIINYDILSNWVPVLQGCGIGCVILDEGHLCKNRNALRTRGARALCKDILHVLILTGTPIVNRPAELWPLLNIIQPKQFNSFFSWAHRFCSPKKRPWGWEFKGATNLPELHNILKTIMIRRLKEDVLQDLPAKQRVVIPLDITKRNEYNRAFSDFIAWLQEQSYTKADAATKAIQLSKTGYLKRLAARLKLKAVFEWIDNFLEEADGKLAVFAHHKFMVAAVKERYEKLSVVVNGDTPKHKRMEIADKFNASKSLRLFIGNIDAAGVGLDITGAHTVAFIELAWTPSQHSQCEDRCYGRLNDLHGATVYYLIARETIEEDICCLIQKKQQILDAVLDGGPTDSGFSVFDDLMESLKRKATTLFERKKYGRH